jgi:large subunit ribosomal protein L18
MDNSLKKRKRARWARICRVRNQIHGTADKPRLTVSKTNLHIYAQLIDDTQGITLGGFGTLSSEVQGTEFSKKSMQAAKHVGEKIAHLAKEKNIQTVVFDRGRYKFHGVIAQLANAAREAGLQF